MPSMRIRAGTAPLRITVALQALHSSLYADAAASRCREQHSCSIWDRKKYDILQDMSRQTKQYSSSTVRERGRGETGEGGELN